MLVIQLRNCNTRVQMSVLGALKNLSYGRTNDENRQMIVTEHGLPELLLALKNSTANEVYLRNCLCGDQRGRSYVNAHVWESKKCLE